MPRARYSSDFYSHPSSSYPIHDPDVPPGLLFSLIGAGIFILYNILHAPLRLPPPSELVFMMIGSMLGPGARETLQNAFSSGGRSVAERVRTRAASLVSGTLLPGGYGSNGEGYVGGLWNTGNTCYQNSVLQAMASLYYLKPHLASLSLPEGEGEDLNPSGALMSLITALNTLTPNPRASTPSPVIVRGTDNSGWVYNEQQDAQEFFQKLTGSLEKEVARFLDRRKRNTMKGLEGLFEPDKPADKKIWQHPELDVALGKDYRSPFEGLFAQRVGCLRCGYVEAISLQPFTSLSLSLPSSWSCSLEECLDEFTAIEQIPEVDCDKCTLLKLHSQLSTLAAQTLIPEVKAQLTPHIEALESALDNDDFCAQIPGVKIAPRQKMTSTKTKQTMIARPPPVLVLHLNRSQYDMVTGLTGKNYAAVSFPARMDLGRLGVVTRHDVEGGSWGLGVDPARRMSGRVPRWVMKGEEIDGEGTDGTEEDDTEEDKDLVDDEIEPTGESVIYELKSVVAHYGGHHNGHYVCYRKHQRQWFKISDHEVYACDEQDALNAGNAFMLFYERVAVGDSKMNGVANGNAKAGYELTNGIIDEGVEPSDGDGEDAGEEEETGDDDDDDATLVNGYVNGNGNALKQDGLRRRVERVELEDSGPEEVAAGR